MKALYTAIDGRQGRIRAEDGVFRLQAELLVSVPGRDMDVTVSVVDAT